MISKSTFRRLGACLMAFSAPIGAAGGLSAQEAANDEAMFRQLVVNYAQGAGSVDDMLARLMSAFAAADLDDVPGLNARDSELSVAMAVSRQRAQGLSDGLSRDLDGDFSVSSKELEVFARQQASGPLRAGQTMVEPTEEQKAQIAADELLRWMEFDIDGDGNLSLAELSARAGARFGDRAVEDRGLARYVPIFDADGDRTGTAAEFRAAVGPIIAGLDQNSDGLLTNEEVQSGRQSMAERLRDAMREAKAPVKIPACTLSALPDGAGYAVISGYEGAALSTARLGAEGAVTTVADVRVPAGDGPIVLFASVYQPVILRLGGATDRVSAVITLAAGVGVTGMPEGRVVPIRSEAATCGMELWEGSDDDLALSLQALLHAAGKPAAATVVAYTLGVVDLGAGTNRTDAPLPGDIRPDGEGPAATVWRRMSDFNPGGLIAIDPTTVTSSLDVSAYDPLPQEAGIARLVEAGALLPMAAPEIGGQFIEFAKGKVRIGAKTFVPGTGDDLIRHKGLLYTEETPGVWIGRKRQEYLVVKELTLPAGLTGAHSVGFIVPKGVPDPKGDLGHSSIREVDLGATDN